MNPIIHAAVELQKFLLQNRLPFCFIGGLAVLRWGKPRTTQDVDASMFVAPGTEAEVISRVLEKFEARLPDAASFALESRVILAKSNEGIALDIAMAQFEFEKQIIERASYFKYDNSVELLTISAEDLVVLKSFAGREQDWLDVQGIIECDPKLDRNAIETQLFSLLEIQSENDASSRLKKLFHEIDG